MSAAEQKATVIEGGLPFQCDISDLPVHVQIACEALEATRGTEVDVFQNYIPSAHIHKILGFAGIEREQIASTIATLLSDKLLMRTKVMPTQQGDSSSFFAYKAGLKLRCRAISREPLYQNVILSEHKIRTALHSTKKEGHRDSAGDAKPQGAENNDAEMVVDNGVRAIATPGGVSVLVDGNGRLGFLGAFERCDFMGESAIFCKLNKKDLLQLVASIESICTHMDDE